MPVEISGIPIANWTPVIIRGAPFQIPITFRDASGEPDPLISASIIITPNGSAEEQWTQGNGLFLELADGEFTTYLLESDTNAIAWDNGSYRIEIVDSSGFSFPCITEGLIFAKDC